MSSVAEITARLVEEGVPLEEAAQLAAQYALRPSATQAPESRVDGAPAADIGSDAPLTPQGYTDDLGRATRQARDEGMTFQQPGTAAFETEGDLLQYRPGMSEEDYSAAKANRASELRMIRGSSPDPGGYTAFHPQQSGYLGTAEQQEEWKQFLEENPEAQERYDPAAYEARMAEQRQAEDEQHAKGLQRKYGPQGSLMAEEYLASKREERPVDSSVFRSPMENAKVDERQALERIARGFTQGIDDRDLALLGFGPERQADHGKHSQHGPNQTQGNFRAVWLPWRYGWMVWQPRQSSRLNPDGEEETMAKTFARRTGDRQDKLDARRRRVATNAMLAGPNPGRNMTNAFDMLGNPSDFGLTQNQQRALQYMLPGGQLAAEVESRQLQSAQEIATSALRGTLGNALMAGGLGGAGGAAPADVGAMAYEQTQRGNLTHPSVIAYAKQYYETNWSFTGRDRVEKTIDHLTLTLPGMDEPTARRIAESF
jgi:hypothetical protein